MTVKEIREKNNLSVQEFATTVGVSRQHIYKLEKGNKKPSVELAKAIGKAFKVKWYLFFE